MSALSPSFCYSVHLGLFSTFLTSNLRICVIVWSYFHYEKIEIVKLFLQFYMPVLNRGKKETSDSFVPRGSRAPWLGRASLQRHIPLACTSAPPPQTEYGRHVRWAVALGSASETRGLKVPPCLTERERDEGGGGPESRKIWLGIDQEELRWAEDRGVGERETGVKAPGWGGGPLLVRWSRVEWWECWISYRPGWTLLSWGCSAASRRAWRRYEIKMGWAVQRTAEQHRYILHRRTVWQLSA